MARVMIFSLDLISHIINLPVLSEKDLSSWKEKLLLKRIATPPLELEQELNRDLRPHSADHTEEVFSGEVVFSVL